MEDEIDIEIDSHQLIPLVKARPALYDKTLPSYCDRPLKQKLWIEICENIKPGWQELSLNEKAQIGIKIHKRWQNLRTSFKREFNLQKDIQRFGKSLSKRKKYEFYDNLSFLMPTVVDKSKSASRSIMGSLDEETSTPETSANVDSTFEFVSAEPQLRPRSGETPNKRAKKVRYIDEDRHFLLSMLPSLRRMNHVQKMKVKIKFLQAIHEFEETQQSSLSSQSMLEETNRLHHKRHIENLLYL